VFAGDIQFTYQQGYLMARNDSDLDKLSGGSASLTDSGMYVFMDSVEPDTIAPIIEWILEQNYVVPVAERKQELLLMICSEGGELAAAFALIDVMRSSSIPIKTVGLGQIASSGLLIFMTGTKGRRVLTPNTSILSHQFSWANEGKSSELFATVKEYDLTQRRMINHYKSCTGLNDAKIKEFLLPPQDIWLDANEALKLGICDSIAYPNQPQSQKSTTKKVKTK
jgi:ATP-dependent Clp protease protease subunit